MSDICLNRKGNINDIAMFVINTADTANSTFHFKKRKTAGDAVAVGAVVCLIDTSAEKPEGSDAPQTEEKKSEAPKAETKKEKASVTANEKAKVEKAKVEKAKVEKAKVEKAKVENAITTKKVEKKAKRKEKTNCAKRTGPRLSRNSC